MKVKLRKLLYILTLIIQIGIILGVFILQYLTKKKAGVMHHVYYRKYQFENSIFSLDKIETLRIVFIIICIILLINLIYSIRANKKKFYKIQSIIAFILSISVYIILVSKLFSNMIAYHYFIMAFILVLIIQLLILIFNFK